jgi:GABA(A) receptor-associated protein
MFKYFIRTGPVLAKSGYEFKMQHSFDKRKEESDRLRNKHPEKIPIIMEKSNTLHIEMVDSKAIIKQKYLIQKDLTIGQLIFIIRRQIKLDPSQSLFVFIDNKHIPSTSATLEEVYSKYHDTDGFLYMTYSAEQTFG